MKIYRFLIFAGIIILATSWFSQSPLWKKTKALPLPKKEIKRVEPSDSKTKSKEKRKKPKYSYPKKDTTISCVF